MTEKLLQINPGIMRHLFGKMYVLAKLEASGQLKIVMLLRHQIITGLIASMIIMYVYFIAMYGINLKPSPSSQNSIESFPCLLIHTRYL